VKLSYPMKTANWVRSKQNLAASPRRTSEENSCWVATIKIDPNE
jgi:hypothetical protein